MPCLPNAPNTRSTAPRAGAMGVDSISPRRRRSSGQWASCAARRVASGTASAPRDWFKVLSRMSKSVLSTVAAWNCDSGPLISSGGRPNRSGHTLASPTALDSAPLSKSNHGEARFSGVTHTIPKSASARCRPTSWGHLTPFSIRVEIQGRGRVGSTAASQSDVASARLRLRSPDQLTKTFVTLRTFQRQQVAAAGDYPTGDTQGRRPKAG